MTTVKTRITILKEFCEVYKAHSVLKENDFVLRGILGSKGKSQRVLEEHKTRFAAPLSLGSVADFYLQEAENRSEKD